MMKKIFSSNCYIQNYTLNKNGSKFISISSYKEVEENPNVSTLIFKLTIYGVLCWQMLVHTKSYCEKVKLNWKILSMWHEPKSFQGKQMLKSSIFEGNIIKQPHIKFLVFTCTTCKKNFYNRYDIPVYAAVIWLKYCWYDIKTIDQSINIVHIEQVGRGDQEGKKLIPQRDNIQTGGGWWWRCWKVSIQFFQELTVEDYDTTTEKRWLT